MTCWLLTRPIVGRLLGWLGYEIERTLHVWAEDIYVGALREGDELVVEREPSGRHERYRATGGRLTPIDE